MQPIQGVIRSLSDLLDAHDRLLIQEKEKQSCLSEENRTDDLLALLQEQTKLIKHISSLEEERQQQVSAYINQLGFPDSSPFTVSDLIKLVTSRQDKAALMEYSQKLNERIEQIRQQNQLNQQLIEQSLSYINFTLRLVTEEPEPYVTYNRRDVPSKQAPAQQRSFFDSKA